MSRTDGDTSPSEPISGSTDKDPTTEATEGKTLFLCYSQARMVIGCDKLFSQIRFAIFLSLFLNFCRAKTFDISKEGLHLKLNKLSRPQVRAELNKKKVAYSSPKLSNSSGIGHAKKNKSSSDFPTLPVLYLGVKSIRRMCVALRISFKILSST